MNRYLRSTEIIDWQTPAVLERASLIAARHTEPEEIARACFEWVRDRIKHSGDYRAPVTTCRASEVLREETGWCFAKSHLLAALLRANGLRAGLCYQRLSRDEGNGFTLHGLVAVHLPDFGWYRIDARGNKPGVDAQFCPPTERLAWSGTAKGEMNFPEIWPDPVPIVVDCLRNNRGWEAMKAALPDIPVIATAPEPEGGIMMDHGISLNRNCPCTQKFCPIRGNCVLCAQNHLEHRRHIPECIQDMLRDTVRTFA